MLIAALKIKNLVKQSKVSDDDTLGLRKKNNQQKPLFACVRTCEMRVCVCERLCIP